MKYLHYVIFFLTVLLIAVVVRVETFADAPETFDARDLFVHVPPQTQPDRPLRVLVALHGVGMEGDAFAQSLIAESDRQGWVLVAPTMHYGNWTDVTRLWQDDLHYARVLNATLDSLENRLGQHVDKRVLVYGFSRGAQLAHRYALLYPERVQAVSVVSAGSFALPTQDKLPLPVGVSDLQLYQPGDRTPFKRIPFWVGVGEKDDRASDVPREFDATSGRTRVERAHAFYDALKTLGMDAQLTVFPSTGHELTPEMQNEALKFLNGH